MVALSGIFIRLARLHRNKYIAADLILHCDNIKRRMGRATDPSFGMTPTLDLCSVVFKRYIVGFCLQPPKVRCETRIWHPNINEDGEVCLSLLRQNSLDALGESRVGGRERPGGREGGTLCVAF